MQGVKSYQEVGKTKDTACFVKKYSGLVHQIANHIHKSLSYQLDLDDLLQSGLVGLLEARVSFDVQGGAAFSTYATLKIRYAIYEHVRKASGITRDISQNIKKIDKALKALGECATDQKVAEVLGVSLNQYMDMVGQINTFKSLNRFEPAEDIENIKSALDDPLELVSSEDFKQNLRGLLQTLPERDRTIMALYYLEEVNFKQIADILGYTEARISQIHNQTLLRLKNRMHDLVAIDK